MLLKIFTAYGFFFFVIDFCSLETNEGYQLLLLSVLHLKWQVSSYVGPMCVFK